ncbi:hypothetical protein DL96DRAFT_1626967 [Flagelloscypha sp. PMI_526]|nr:hypothetical protein DL96DRAFT_1626967 [Flagelloscypha sp. PMI_526]
MTWQEQRLPNEILAPILQYSCWERPKSDQLGIMLLSRAAVEFISWVLYHDIISLEHTTGSKYFAHRVRALWIDITPPNNSLDIEDTATYYSRALHLPFIISTCRNIRHRRLFASTHLDALLQSALARPRLISLTLSEAFYEPIFGVGWEILLAGYPTPALTSITHFTMEIPQLMEGGSPPFISLFTNLTHVCFHWNGLLSTCPEPFMPNLMQKRSLENVVCVDRLRADFIDQFDDYEDLWEIWLSSVFRGHGWLGNNHSDIPVYLVPDVPAFGTLEEWRALVLGGRLPELEISCVWNRKPWVHLERY